MQKHDSSSNADELDFVSILATVVRRRRWVYGGFGAGLVAALFFLYLLPVVGVSLSDEKKDFAVTLIIPPVPNGISGYIGGVLANIVVADFQNIDFKDAFEVYDEVAKAKGLGRPEGKKELKNLLDNLSATKDIALTRVQLEFPAAPSFGKELIEALLEYQKKVTGARLRALLQRASAAWKTQLTDSPAAVEFTALTVDTKLLLEDSSFPFAVEGEITENSRPHPSRVVLALVIVLGGLVAGILMALVMEALVSVYRSPAKRKVLIDAWKRTKP